MEEHPHNMQLLTSVTSMLGKRLWYSLISFSLSSNAAKGFPLLANAAISSLRAPSSSSYILS